MWFKSTLIADALFVAGFCCVIVGAKNLGNAAWEIAIFSLPACLVASKVSSILSDLLWDGQKNIFVDLAGR
jgi:hypothetical protein